MHKKNAGTEHKVILDVCRNGHGLWFDGGEVIQFAEQVAGSGQTSGGTDNAALDYIKDFFGKS